MRHNESDPENPTTAISSGNPPRVPATPSDKLDPEEFRRIYPFVWDGLSDAEILDRIDHYRLPGTDDLGDGLEKMTQQTQKALTVHDALYDRVVGMLRKLLRAELKRNSREEIADLADELIERVEDAACRGDTRGEQRLSLFYRHPYVWSTVADFPIEAIKDVRRLHRTTEPLAYLRMIRETRDIQSVIESVLPKDKRQRETLDRRQKEDVITELIAEFPELAARLKSPPDLVDLTPELAARVVWGQRQQPPIVDKTVSNRLADAKLERLFRRKPKEFFDRLRGRGSSRT